MRILIAATAACLLTAGVAQAKDMKACNADWKAQKASAAASGQTRKQFMTTCLSIGSPGVAPAPAATPTAHPDVASSPALKASTAASTKVASAPTGATAKCKDGAFSMSKHHSGSCSHHGGVAQFLQ